MIIWSDNYMSYMSKAEMNVLELKNGDIVTLTALYDGDGGGNPLKKLIMDDDDTNIYATPHQHLEWLFIQYKGNTWYRYISCDLDDVVYDFPTQSYIIKDIKIQSHNYPLSSGWRATNDLYLVQLSNNNVSFINWLNENPFEVKS